MQMGRLGDWERGRLGEGRRGDATTKGAMSALAAARPPRVATRELYRSCGGNGWNNA